MMFTAIKSWAWNVLIAFDQFCNCLFFAGMPDETISAHAGRAMLAGRRWGKVLSWLLNALQRKHVQQAIAGDDQRAELVDKTEMAAAESENRG